MANLNKHRKAITEAGYTLSKDGTQVTNKEGKTVAGTNDNGFFSGSSTLTKIFKGDTKAKEKAPTKSSKKAPAETAPKTSKRPPARPKRRETPMTKEQARRYTSASPAGTPMTKEQARRYTSASPAGTPTLMSQGGNNAETQNNTPAPEPAKKSLFRNAQGKNVADGGWGRLFKRQDKPKDTQKAPATTPPASATTASSSGGGMGTINGVTFSEYESMSQAQRKAADLPLKLNEMSWKTRVMLDGKK